MRTRAHDQQVTRRLRSRVDRVARCLEREHQVAALLGSERLLHFVDDQHHAGLHLVHELGEGLCQGDAALLAHAVELEAEGEPGRPEVQALEAVQQSGAGGGQLRQGVLHRLMDQGGCALAAVGPEIDVDHQRPHGFQRRDQVLAQEGGLADAADAGQEDSGAHLQLQ